MSIYEQKSGFDCPVVHPGVLVAARKKAVHPCELCWHKNYCKMDLQGSPEFWMPPDKNNFVRVDNRWYFDLTKLKVKPEQLPKVPIPCARCRGKAVPTHVVRPEGDIEVSYIMKCKGKCGDRFRMKKSLYEKHIGYIDEWGDYRPPEIYPRLLRSVYQRLSYAGWLEGKIRDEL